MKTEKRRTCVGTRVTRTTFEQLCKHSEIQRYGIHKFLVIVSTLSRDLLKDALFKILGKTKHNYLQYRFTFQLAHVCVHMCVQLRLFDDPRCKRGLWADGPSLCLCV